MPRFSYILTALSIAALLAMGCSGGGSGDAISPTDAGISATEIGGGASIAASGHALWGMWQFQVEPDTLSVTATPLRYAAAHFNITDMLLPPNCNDCLKTKINSFDPVTRILDVDVTLRNPTTITGHDVRGILYTNDYGHELRNADDWTGLFDIPGGQTINPFKAFA